MKITIAFDFHDIFVDAKTAWIQAFLHFCQDPNIEADYNSGMPKKEICRKYALSYPEVEDFYRTLLRPIPQNIEFAEKLSAVYPLVLVSMARGDRLQKDLEKTGLAHLFSQIYAKEQVVDRKTFLRQLARNSDWLVFFNHDSTEITREGNFICIPIHFEGNLSDYSQVSFTEHARNKILYNELSGHYMQAIANDTKSETSFLKSVFQQYFPGAEKKVLDCCCGVGRHDYQLAQDGYRVTGIDIAPPQVETARRIHNHPNAVYMVGDVRAIDLPEKDFSYAMCMWTTYNYLSQERDLQKFFRCVYAHQPKGGILVLDAKNIPALDKRRVYRRSRTDGSSYQMELLINKRILGSIQNSQYFYFINDAGQPQFYFDEEFVRFYDLDELSALVRPCYEIIGVYGDFDQSSYHPAESNRFITIMRRL